MGEKIKMKKSILILSCVLALSAFFATGCESTEEEELTAAQEASKNAVAGADGVARPEWVLSGKEDDTGIYAVGTGKMSNLTNSIRAAELNGRAELARTVSAATQSVVNQYTQDTGSSKDVLTYLEDITQTKTANVLKGSKRVDYWQAENGTVFVLMYIPYNAVLPNVVEPINEMTEDVTNFTQSVKATYTEAKALAAFEKYFEDN